MDTLFRYAKEQVDSKIREAEMLLSVGYKRLAVVQFHAAWGMAKQFESYGFIRPIESTFFCRRAQAQIDRISLQNGENT